MAAALTADMPKYDPIATQAVSPDLVAPAAAVGDAPKNQIVRLPNDVLRMPNYVVRERKTPEFSERELHTAKGLQELAMKRYITEFDYALNRYQIPLFSGYSTASDRGGSPQKRAMALFEEDELKHALAEIRELTALEKIR